MTQTTPNVVLNRDRYISEFIVKNVPTRVLNGSALTVRRWATKFLLQQLGSTHNYLCRNNDGTVCFSFSKSSWASDQTNRKKRHSAQEAIIYSIAEYFTGN